MWILIDLSHMAHRVHHTMGHLISHDTRTGVVYGFFEQLYALAKEPRFHSNRVEVFTDSKTSHRRNEFAGYKSGRRTEKTPEEMEELQVLCKQVSLLKHRILPMIGIPVYRQKGLEADDLMAYAARVLSKNKKQAVMVTSDADLCQCITPYVSWYDPTRQNLQTAETFPSWKGVTPTQWGMVKAIGGCSSDSVPGVSGVSEKSAVAFLNDTLPHHHARYQKITSAFASGEIERWKNLVVLPHHTLAPFQLKPPRYQPDIFFKVCKKLGLDSYLTDAGMKKWAAFFEGHFVGEASRRKKGRLL